MFLAYTWLSATFCTKARFFIEATSAASAALVSVFLFWAFALPVPSIFLVEPQEAISRRATAATAIFKLFITFIFFLSFLISFFLFLFFCP